MTCLEAQSYIMAFVDGNLSEDKLDEFVLHMRHCSNCFEELEIYYTLIVGINKLDNNQELPRDFKAEINKIFKRIESKKKNSFKFKFSAFSIFLVAFVVCCVFFYKGFLGYVYNYEQGRKVTLRGENYFYSTFNEELFRCDKDIIYNYQLVNIKNDETVYDIIKKYNSYNRIR